MNQSEEQSSSVSNADVTNSSIGHEVKRLYRLVICVRWLVVVLLWITIGFLSLWELRYPISLIRENFTWAAVRYGLVFNPLPAIGLAICLGMTIGLLIGQGSNFLFGLPDSYRKRLEKQVCQIRQQGSSHPLWRFVCGSK